MNASLTRRGRIRAVTFLAAAFVVTCGLAAAEHQEALRYQRYTQLSYVHAFGELTTAVREMDTALQKGSCASSPVMLATLCTEIFGKAMAAQMAMGELPYANVELEQTAAFVAKVGDYAYALSRAAAGGEADSGTPETLAALADQAAALARRLEALEADVQSGAYTLEELSQVRARLAAAQGEGPEKEAGGYQEIEGELSQLPTLIYDGPFSDHLQSRASSMLEGREQLSPEEGRARAAAFAGLRPEIFSLVSTVEGAIPAYAYAAAVDGGELTVQVSRAGGMPLAMLSSRPLGEATLSADEAVDRARAFLEERGFPGMRESYYIRQGNVLTVNLAAVQGEVICYPDLIKVSVALDNGRIIGFEADGYVMNHTTRALPEVTLSLAEAQAALSPRLRQLSHQLAVIPTLGSHELLCYEFKCETEQGQHFIVYLNAQTGREERMLLLLEDESGTLAL